MKPSPYQAQSRIKNVLRLLTDAPHIDDAPVQYYCQTRDSAAFALDNKKFTFLDLPTCEKNKDRVSTWNEVNALVLPWWRASETITLRHLPPAFKIGSKRRGTYNRNEVRSKNPRVAGTVIHEEFAPNLAEAAFPGAKSLVPGRIYNPSFAIVGTRPDAVSVCDPSKFVGYLGGMYEIDPVHPPLEVDATLKTLSKSAAPLVLHEIKTVHSPASVDVDASEIERILGSTDPKESLLEAVTKRLEDSNWASGDLFRVNSGRLSYQRARYQTTIPARKMGILAEDGADVSHLFRPRPGSIVVWDRTGRKVRFRADYPVFPFVLSPACDHFCQMLQQRVTYHFLNPDVESKLSVVYKFATGKNIPAIQVVINVPCEHLDVLRFVDRANALLKENLIQWPDMKSDDLVASFAPKLFSTINEDSML